MLTPVGEKRVLTPDRSCELERVCSLLIRHYVFPEVGDRIVELLRARHPTGAFDDTLADDDFAMTITDTMQSVNGDRHLRLLYSVNEIPIQADEDAEVSDEGAYRQEVSMSAGGISAAQRLDGNVGYLDIRVLHDANVAAPLASAAMTLLAGSGVLLIDLRGCRGGSPLMVAHYCSYLFDDPTHLSDVYDRPSNTTRQFWTAPWVPGEKFGGSKPVYVLTSSNTFSGAEELSYDLQTLGRATVIGERTKGGANPGRRYRIGSHLQLFVPQGRAINSVSGTNWEGTGVTPDVEVAAEDAFGVAYEMALDHVIGLARDGVYRSVTAEAEAARVSR